MGLENWTDLHKQNKELLDDDFNHGQALVLKTKAKGNDGAEISTTYKQGAPDAQGDSKVAFEGKFKSTTGLYSHEVGIKQDGAASWELKRNLESLSNVKGLNLLVNGSAQTSSSTLPEVKAGLDYNAEKLRAKVLFNLRTLLGEGSFTYLAKPNTTVGANLIVNPKTALLEKYDWGINWSPAGTAQVGLRHESANPKQLAWGKFFLLVNHVANANQTVGTEFTLDWQKKAVEARLGLLHRFSDDTQGKFKVNHNGYVDAVLKHKLNSWVTANLATGFSVKGIVAEQKAKKLPFGLALDFKF